MLSDRHGLVRKENQISAMFGFNCLAKCVIKNFLMDKWNCLGYMGGGSRYMGSVFPILPNVLIFSCISSAMIFLMGFSILSFTLKNNDIINLYTYNIYIFPLIYITLCILCGSLHHWKIEWTPISLIFV